MNRGFFFFLIKRLGYKFHVYGYERLQIGYKKNWNWSGFQILNYGSFESWCVVVSFFFLDSLLHSGNRRKVWETFTVIYRTVWNSIFIFLKRVSATVFPIYLSGNFIGIVPGTYPTLLKCIIKIVETEKYRSTVFPEKIKNGVIYINRIPEFSSQIQLLN